LALDADSKPLTRLIVTSWWASWKWNLWIWFKSRNSFLWRLNIN